jgi:hypothetical protein
MALIVEDGTGVVGANSFVTDVEFQTWAKARGRYDTLPATIDSGTARAPYLVQGADYLCNEQRFWWRGTRTSAEQSLVWPRTGVVDRDGKVWPDNVVPWRIKTAQCVLGWLAMTGVDLQPALTRGGRVQSKSVGPISTTYFADAPPETIFAEAEGFLDPLLLTSGKNRALRSMPYFSPVIAVDGFEGEYLPENSSPTPGSVKYLP